MLNNLTIDDGGNGTVEQIGGGWGNTYVMAGTNSAVTIKCILLGVTNYRDWETENIKGVFNFVLLRGATLFFCC